MEGYSVLTATSAAEGWRFFENARSILQSSIITCPINSAPNWRAK
jgi:hypothetical protein